MTGVQIRIAADTAPVQAQLGRLLAAAGDLTPAMDEIGSTLVASTILRFEQQTDPEGRRWLPSKAALKRKGLTLVDSARLKLSVTHEATARAVAVGTNVIYAAIHQLGGEIRKGARTQTLAFDRKGRFTSRAKASKRKAGFVPVAFAQISAHVVNMPARAFLGVSEGDEADILDVLARHLSDGAPDALAVR